MKRKLIFIFTLLSLAGLVIAADSPYASRIRPSTTHTGSCAENSILYDMTNHTPYYCSDSGWTAFGGGGGGAPTDATYITQTPNGSLSAEQALSALATGILKNTTTTGVLSIAVAGTDYQVPITAGDVTTSGATATIGALKVTNAMLAGSIADSKLSANVMLLDAVQAITGAKTFNPAKLIIGTNAGAPAVVANSFYRETGDSKLYIGNAAGSAWDEIFEAGVSLVSLTSNVTGILPGTNGGTGVNNSTRTITIAGNFATTGAFNTTLATGFTGTITLPTATSTLATLALAESLTNKTLTSSTNVLGGVTLTLGSDATGDIYYRNSGGVLTRLGIGSSTQVLTVTAGLPSWAAAGGGGTPCTTTALSLQYNNAGSFGCISTATTDGSIITLAANGIAGTSTDRLILSNSTAATNGTQQWSPALHFIAQGWDGSGSANNQVEYFQELVPFQNNSDGFADFLMTWSVKRAAGSKTALLRFGPGIRQAIGSGVAFFPGGVTPSATNYAISINASGSANEINAGTAVYLENASNVELIANVNGVQVNTGLGVEVAPPVGGIAFTKTITAGGTTGAQTINKTTGTVNFAAAATSLVVTDNQVSTASIVFGILRTNDATCRLANIVPASGSFTINMTGACTAETSVGFFVSN